MSDEEFKSYMMGGHSAYGINELVVPLSLKEDFEYWFKKNGKFIKPDNLITKKQFESMNKIFVLEAGLCYGNSQKVIHVAEPYLYFEGFYTVDGKQTQRPISRHAFNVKNQDGNLAIHDFSAYVGQYSPSHYFGIEIPNDFIKKIIKSRFQDLSSFLASRPAYSMIRPYFFNSIGRNDLITDGFFTPE